MLDMGFEPQIKRIIDLTPVSNRYPGGIIFALLRFDKELHVSSSFSIVDA